MKNLQITNSELKNYLLTEFIELKHYELQMNNNVIDVSVPTEGLIEWALERFIRKNNLDYDTHFESLVESGCKIFNLSK